MVARSIYFLIGCAALVLGGIGALLPLMPTTVFLIIAAWAFARSSERLHRWLMHHPKAGPILHNWQEHGVIPRRAKQIATTSMCLSWLIIAYQRGPLSGLSLIAALVLLAAMAYVLSRPSSPRAPSGETA